MKEGVRGGLRRGKGYFDAFFVDFALVPCVEGNGFGDVLAGSFVGHFDNFFIYYN